MLLSGVRRRAETSQGEARWASLEAFLPRRLAAAGLTAGYLAAAAFLGGVGLDQLRAAGGSSARLAEEVSDAVSATAGRVVPAGSAAARDELGR